MALKSDCSSVDKSNEPSFVWDICPYFTATLLYLTFVVAYQLSPNGNPLIVPFAIFLSTPFYNRFLLQNTYVVDKRDERRFANDWRFNLPLYAIITAHTTGWLYGMLLYSEHF